MSQSEYADWLESVGTGVLHWTYAETMRTPMPAILAAYDAHMDMLQMIFGPGKKPERAPESIGAKVKKLFRGLGAKPEKAE